MVGNRNWPGVPVSRSGNPSTSFDAEEAITRSGARSTHAALLYRIIRDDPGLTTGEIGELSGLGQMATRKRLSDLKNAMLVYQGRTRMWTRTRRLHVTWWPTGEPDDP